MKIKEGYMLRQVSGNNVVVAVGKAAKEFNGIITLNNIGAFLWRQLENNLSKEELIKIVLENYDTDKLTAEKDVENFLEKIDGAGFVE